VRRITRLLVLLGVVGLGWFVFQSGRRDVVLVYDVSAVPDATSLEVDVRSEGHVLRHARIVVHRGEQIRHEMKLRDGPYVVAWRLERPGAPLTGERTLDVREDGQIVLPLAP
jgi:hypothetical protein